MTRWTTLPLRLLKTETRRYINSWRVGRSVCALTHQGEVLGFIMALAMPEAVPIESEHEAPLTSATLERVREWQQYDIVWLTYHTTRAVAFVPVKHQAWLPIPVIPTGKCEAIDRQHEEWLKKFESATLGGDR